MSFISMRVAMLLGGLARSQPKLCLKCTTFLHHRMRHWLSCSCAWVELRVQWRLHSVLLESVRHCAVLCPRPVCLIPRCRQKPPLACYGADFCNIQQQLQSQRQNTTYVQKLCCMILSIPIYNSVHSWAQNRTPKQNCQMRPKTEPAQ